VKLVQMVCDTWNKPHSTKLYSILYRSTATVPPQIYQDAKFNLIAKKAHKTCFSHITYTHLNKRKSARRSPHFTTKKVRIIWEEWF